MIPHGHHPHTSDKKRQRSILTFKKSHGTEDSLIDNEQLLSSPLSVRNAKTNHKRFRLCKLATNMELPAQIKKIFAQGESQSASAFKVLQEAQKDVVMNHDLFLSEKQYTPAEVTASESEPLANSSQLIDFIKTALLKVNEER